MRTVQSKLMSLNSSFSGSGGYERLRFEKARKDESKKSLLQIVSMWSYHLQWNGMRETFVIELLLMLGCVELPWLKCY